MKKIVFLILFGLVATSSMAQPGTLDPSFNGTGYVIDTVNLTPMSYITGRTMSVQPNGKILVSAMINTPQSLKTRLFRYNTDGSHDPAFGTDGILDLGYSLGTSIQSLAVQPDGKIVGSGYGMPVAGRFQWVVIRLNADGTYDPGFGTGGIVNTTIYDSMEVANCLKLLPGGEILTSGGALNPTTGKWEYVMVRYLADGTPDPGFGNGGIVIPVIPGGTFITQGMVCLQSDGKVILGGNTKFGTRYTATLMRFLQDGKPDSTFGTNGLVIDSAGIRNGTYTLAAQPDDKIVVPGWVYITDLNHPQFSIFRYNADGSCDETFAAGGHYIGLGGSSYDAFVQPDGRILAAGNLVNDSTLKRPAICRFLPSGELDSGFGDNGFFLLNDSTPGGLNSMVLDPNGNILSTGYCNEQTSPSVRQLLTLRLTAFGVGIIENEVEQRLAISPNPATDKLLLTTSNLNNCNLSVFSADGRLICEKELIGKTTTLDVGSFRPGVYYFKVKSKSGQAPAIMIKR